MASKKELELRILKLEHTVKQLTQTMVKPSFFEQTMFTPSFFEGSQFTIKGKVDAIIEHLGVQFEYKPATDERIVVVKKNGKK